MASKLKESALYEPLRKWAVKKFGCFTSGINTGTDYGRVDVVCMRQTPGDLSAQTEVLCIEVKKGTQPFLNALGQAAGYAIYGEYTYLADYRPKKSFDEEERVLAHQLGVGLIRIKSVKSIELISSAEHSIPNENFKLRIADQLGYVHCSICSTFFERDRKNKNDFALLQRHIENRLLMKKGIEKGKGLMFWPEDASWNDVTHDGRHKDDRFYNRRFLCKTCASLFLSS